MRSIIRYSVLISYFSFSFILSNCYLSRISKVWTLKPASNLNINKIKRTFFKSINNY